MPGWWAPDDDSEFVEPPVLEVESEPNPVVAELLGPAGQTVAVLLERPVVPCGYQSAAKEPTRVVRLSDDAGR